ncbi:MAG: FkbM family methyltransferase [Candidatus Omnitrophota bacterium]
MKQILKDTIRRIFHIFGVHLSRYPLKHKTPVLNNVFGHTVFQNTQDIGTAYGRLANVDIHGLGKLWEDGEINFIVNAVKQGNTVIDIGANIGIVTLLLAKLVGPKGRVVSFEPGPMSFALLTTNVLVNNYKNITLVNNAVSSISGTEQLFICPSGESDNQVSKLPLDWEEDRISIPCHTVSLDDYFSRGGNDGAIDFIKIDTQGGEYKALLGMKNLLARNKNIRLTVEYASYLPLWLESEKHEFFDLVRSLGFYIYDLKSVTPKLVSEKDLLEMYPRNTYRSTGSGLCTTLLLQRDRNI